MAGEPVEALAEVIVPAPPRSWSTAYRALSEPRVDEPKWGRAVRAVRKVEASVHPSRPVGGGGRKAFGKRGAGKFKLAEQRRSATAADASLS